MQLLIVYSLKIFWSAESADKKIASVTKAKEKTIGSFLNWLNGSVFYKKTPSL